MSWSSKSTPFANYVRISIAYWAVIVLVTLLIIYGTVTGGGSDALQLAELPADTVAFMRFTISGDEVTFLLGGATQRKCHLNGNISIRDQRIPVGVANSTRRRGKFC